MDLESRLRAAEQQLRELVHALPPLPSAEELHDKIVQHCVEFHDCTKAVKSLETRAKELSVSRDTLTDRIHQAEYLELQSDHLHLRIIFILTQLRNLFDLCPILMAIRRVRKSEWTALMNRPHSTSNKESLLMELSDIEVVATEQLGRIAEVQSKVRDLRRSYHYEYYTSRISFMDEKPSKEGLYKMDTESPEEVFEQQFERKPAEEGAVDPMQYEQDVVTERIEQMKPDPDDEDTSTPPNVEMDAELDEGESLLELVEDEEYEPENNVENDNCAPENNSENDCCALEEQFRGPESNFDRCGTLPEVKREVEDEDIGSAPQESPEKDAVCEGMTPEEEPAEVKSRETSNDRLSRIKAEIRSAEQDLLNLDEVIRQLQHEPTCSSRNSDRGRIREEKERSMRCVFCGVVGVHYSNSCAKVSTARERRVLVLAHGRCKYCLKPYCKGDDTCKHYNSRCFYCNKKGHHSALCKLPERSDEIRRRIAVARDERLDCYVRLKRWQRKLRRFWDQV